MKTSNKKNSKKTILVIIAIIVLAAISGTATAYFVHKSNSSTSTGTNSENSSDNNTSGESSNPGLDPGSKEEFLDNESGNENSGATPPSFNSDNIIIESSQSNSSVTILAKMTGFTGSGTCTLKVTKGPATVSESAEIIYQPEYSTCAGFSIDKNRLSPGTWSLSLSVSVEGKAYSQTGEFKIK